MASEIRELLAAAQEAEVHGDTPRAVRLLHQAASWYRERELGPRAEQMLRHIDRLERRPGPPEPAGDDGFGFGDELLDGPAPPARRRTELTIPERGPALADPALDAWCSFCCRPRGEVGPLVAGPAGAFICRGCIAAASAIAGGEGAPLPPVGPAPAQRPAVRVLVELPSQRRARERLEGRAPRVALVLGPEGAGKSAFLQSLGAPLRPPFERIEGDTLLVEVAAPLAADDEARLLGWLEEHPRRRAVLAVRGAAPKPVLVLQGERGEEPVYDTDSLRGAVSGLLSAALLAKVEAVLALEAPDEAALAGLAKALLAARETTLPEEALAQLVQLAARSGRGAHELAALLGRIPKGRWSR